MKKGIWLLIFCPLHLFAGNPDHSIGARSIGMGGFSVAVSDLWSAENNAAALAFHEKTSFGAYYENRFLIQEMSYKAFAGSIPLQKATIGISADQYGYHLYNDNKVGISVAKLLSDNISMGVQLNYSYLKIAEGYGSSKAVSGNIGIFAKITDELHLGTSIINPMKVKIADEQSERRPTIIRMGLAYHFSEIVLLGAELSKNMDENTSVRVGIEYHPIEILYLRAGISTAPSTSTFGFGLQFDSFQLDFSSSFHSVLGFSPHISLLFSIDKKKSRNHE